MGYTHYWRHKNIYETEVFVDVTRAMFAIVKAAPVPVAGGAGDGEPELDAGEVVFNGVAEDSHETFAFPWGWDGAHKSFHFCKTAAKPYDVVVTACLAVAKDMLGDEITISSDGDPKDWKDGVRLASKVLGRKIANPLRREKRR